MFSHIADALKTPDIVKLKNNLYIARFESMKIFSTLHAVGKLLENGVINSNTTLIDSSSGIYDYALALACHKYGLDCHIVASKAVDTSMRIQLQLLGAYVEGVPSAGSLKHDQNYRVEKVEKLIKERKNYYWMQQYHNDIHYCGYEEFAKIIIEELDCKEMTVVGGVGSGCSTGAVGIYLRQKNVTVNLCGIQPFSSITFGSQEVGDPEIIIAGIGSAIDFQNVKYNNYDSIDWLSFDVCLSGTIELMRKHAVFAGLSSGGSYCVGSREVRLRPDIPCLIIAPDTGHRYVETVFTRHEEAKEVDLFEPVIISASSELSLPWSRYQWNRKNKQHLNEFLSKR